MSAARVTVGIPTFNRARLLAESIQSVLAQTYTNFSLIVSDNASDDDTEDVVRSFNDPRIRYLRSERNVGAIENLNRLIALAETEYLVLLPDDDVLYPDHLRSTVELLERLGSVGLVHSKFDLIDARSRVIERATPLVSRSAMTIERRDRALERMMVSGWGLCFASVMYRTRAIAEAGGFREEEEPFGDRELWMRVALNWDFAYIDTPLVGFRSHPATITANVAVRHGVNGRERGLLHSQLHFERRMDFLDHAPLERWRTKQLRAMATLQFLVDSAAWGLPWKEVAARLAKLVAEYPRTVLRPAFWRLVAAQLGGRRLRSALRGSITRPIPPRAGLSRSITAPNDCESRFSKH